MGYAWVALDAVVATRPRVTARAMNFEAMFMQADGSPQRVRVVLPSNNGLTNLTRGSSVLIGGQLFNRAQPYIAVEMAIILWVAPSKEYDREHPRVHGVKTHSRLLSSGKRVLIRAHSRGRLGLNGEVQRLASIASQAKREEPA